MRPILFILALLIAGCTSYFLARYELDREYGKEDPARYEQEMAAGPIDFWEDVNPVLEARCVVCHACYDAACQLKLNSYEGITRGLTDEKVYDIERVLAAPTTRLFEDAQTVSEWRELGFTPVLNERENTPEANIEGSVLAQMLLLKEAHPLPNQAVLPDSFDFSLNREQECVAIEEFEGFEKEYPLWGMPYGLPGLSDENQSTLLSWVENGAPFQSRERITPELEDAVAEWESFFNQDSLKGQLTSRYMYEHLFQAHLHFGAEGTPQFFQLVRSRTQPGQPIDRIATRVPFDDPGVERVYYRFEPVRESITVKNHQPYLLDENRMSRWQTLFYDADYAVTALPSYEREVAANPFLAFRQLPAAARYAFMLEEAEYTIMGFIKGPVCRGQTALSVINDYFWVVFAEPEVDMQWVNDDRFVAQLEALEMPAGAGSTSDPLDWVSYAMNEKKYLDVKYAVLNGTQPDAVPFNMDLLWDGDGRNENAALTVFRHSDSASVVKGLLGTEPQTAWVINYPLLERIHYLLVAGYDVFGNLGHQLNTRVYMDFLRMEGEINFLALLPLAERQKVLSHWYRGRVSNLENYLRDNGNPIARDSGIEFDTAEPLPELYGLLKSHLQPVLNDQYNLDSSDVSRRLRQDLSGLNELSGEAVALLPEVLFLEVQDDDESHYFSLLHHRAFSNVSHMLNEEARRLPQEDTLSVNNGLIGAYPNVFLRVDAEAVGDLKNTLQGLQTEQDYAALLDRFGIRRSNPQFWQTSDDIHQAFLQSQPVTGGLLDFNRLENR